MLCIWWDCRGIIYKEYLEKVKTLNSNVYSEMLVRVVSAIKENVELSSGAKRLCSIKITQDHMCLHSPAGLCTNSNGIFCNTYHIKQQAKYHLRGRHLYYLIC